jgi:CheY-like chemotaxis protein
MLGKGNHLLEQDILVVEDEPSIASLLAKVLARAGHSVRVCMRPEPALEGARTYALAIVDYSLPGMDGLALIHRLRERQPDLPVILCSGLPMNPPVMDPPIHFVQKPYRPRQLGELVATLKLDATI